MIRAGRSLEHPGRNLQPAIRVRPAQRAAENDTVGLLDRFMNGHLKLKPRVPRIQKLPKHGPVGVLKPCCTVREDGTEVRIDIYRLETTDWSLEVVDEAGTSTVWDDLFPTDQAALDEALKTCGFRRSRPGKTG